MSLYILIRILGLKVFLSDVLHMLITSEVVKVLGLAKRMGSAHVLHTNHVHGFVPLIRDGWQSVILQRGGPHTSHVHGYAYG